MEVVFELPSEYQATPVQLSEVSRALSLIPKGSLLGPLSFRFNKHRQVAKAQALTPDVGSLTIRFLRICKAFHVLKPSFSSLLLLTCTTSRY